MLQKIITDPHRPLPWQWFGQGVRQVVMVQPIFYRRALLLTQPTNDPTGTTYIPMQGECEEGETVIEAARREAKEEVYSFARPNQRAPWRLVWPEVCYLGSAANPSARSGRPSMVHCVVVPAVHANLRVNTKELRDAIWVFNQEGAESLLRSTQVQNPTKYDIITAVRRSANRLGLIG